MKTYPTLIIPGLILFLSMFPFHTKAQNQLELLADPFINPVSYSGLGNNYVEMDGVMYFLAFERVTGNTALWRTDGTATGTYLLERGIRRLGGLAADTLNNILYFSGSSCDTGNELAKSDGTPGSQAIVKEVNVGPLSSSLRNLQTAGTKVYYEVEGSTDPGLWVSEGMGSNTFQLLAKGNTAPVKEIDTYAALGDKLMVAVRDDGDRYELWATDGTVANTGPLINFSSQQWDDYPFGFQVYKDTLFFFVENNNNQFELWKTAGANTNTVKVGIAGTAKDEDFYQLVELNDTLFFLSQDIPATDSIILKKTGGAVGGIQEIARFPKTDLEGIASLQDELMIVLRNFGGGPIEFWQSDGSQGGTRLFDTLAFAGSLAGVAHADSLLFYNFNDSLWRTDGTQAGTFSIGQKQGYIFSQNNYTTYNKQLFYQGFDSGVQPSHTEYLDVEMYLSDGTEGGTSLLVDTDTLPFSTPLAKLGVVGDKFIFIAESDTLDLAPWVSDGTPGGTRFLKDITEGLSPGFTTDVSYGTASLWDNSLYFTANIGDGTFRLWKTDGSSAGTTVVDSTLNIGRGMLGIKNSIVFQNELYFQGVFQDAPLVDYGSELWKMSTPGSPVELFKDLDPGFKGGKPFGFVEVNGALVFAAETVNEGIELWVSDGTPAGTQILKDINPTFGNGLSLNFSGAALVGNQLFFQGLDNTSGRELWVTDATSMGTRRVADIAPGQASSFPGWLTPFNNQLVFLANTDSTGIELWISDGTEAGTSLIKDIFPGVRGSFGLPGTPKIIATDSLVLFSTYDEVNGTELWRTDGTDPGTFVLKDIIPGACGSFPNFYTQSDSLIYFTVRNEDYTQSIWQTDGTEGGTQLAFGFPAESPFASIYDLQLKDSTIFFFGLHGEYGSTFFSFTPGEGSVPLDPLFAQANIQVFPNPISDLFQVKLEEAPIGKMQVNLLDLQGRQVFAQQVQLSRGETTFQVNAAHLPAGVYLLRVQSEQGTYATKVVVR